MPVIYEISDATHTYVGKTTRKNPLVRFKEHLKVARRGRNTPLYRWLQTAEDVYFKVLCKCGPATVDDYEILYIQEARAGPKKCLNLNDGGEGHTSESAKALMKRRPDLALDRAADMKKSWEGEAGERHRAAMRKPKGSAHKKKLQAHLARVRPDQTGMKRSPETRERMRQAALLREKRKRERNGNH